MEHDISEDMQFDVRDGSLFMGMTGSREKLPGFAIFFFSVSDGGYFFLQKSDWVMNKWWIKSQDLPNEGNT